MGKRILISVTNDLSIDQRVDRAARTLVENGWEVLLVGRKLPDSKPLADRPYQTKRLRHFFVTGKIFYLEFTIRLFFFLLFRRADTFLSNDMDTLLPNFLVARLRGKRVLYDSHEYWTEVPELIARPGTRKVWLWLERRLFPRVNAAATVNHSIADVYKELYGKNLHVIRNLPFKKPIPALRSAPGKVIIYQGALNVGRGLELMIDAMGYLEGYELWIVGYGPIQEELHARAAATGWADRIDFKGRMHYDDLPPITAQASLGLSIEEDRGMSYHFALPNKLFDYVQAGTPVLISDLPEMRRITDVYGVGETLGKEERVPERFAERVREILENGEAWRKAHEACRKASEELCWENERARLLEFVG